jgi:Fe-S-cluster containining protein
MTEPAVYVNSETLAKMFRSASPKDQSTIIWLHRDLERNLQKAAAENPGNPEGIAAGGQALVDEAVAYTLAHDKHGPDVKCSRGCGACCRLHVIITAGEAKLAAMAAQDVGWLMDVERLRVQAQAKTAEQWKALPESERACVLLTSGEECAIYPYRPMACRKYMVVSPPEDCDTVLKPGGEVQQLVSAHAEIAFSASLQVLPSGPLAEMLLAELTLQNKATP